MDYLTTNGFLFILIVFGLSQIPRDNIAIPAVTIASIIAAFIFWDDIGGGGQTVAGFIIIGNTVRCFIYAKDLWLRRLK